MKAIVAAAALALVASSTAAQTKPKAVELTRVESPVYEAAGDHQALAKRANVCAAQVLKPGVVNASVVRAFDAEAGTVVAQSGFEFEAFDPFRNVYLARQVLTVEARDGRFRLVSTEIDFLRSGRWGRWEERPGGALEKRLLEISARVADCIKVAPSDW